MLGHQLFRTLSRTFDTHATIRRPNHNLMRFVTDETRLHVGITAEDIESIRSVLGLVRPTHVINCIGIIKQQRAAQSPIPSIEINALFPHRLAELCATTDSHVIHFSTDCVFSGAKGNYLETDPPDALDLYGKTKALGELPAAAGLTLRTSIVGTALNDNLSLFDWFIANPSPVLQGYTHAIYTGLTTAALAREVANIIERPWTGGLWNVASEKISKFELLTFLNDALELGKQIAPTSELKCDRSLDGGAYRSATGFMPPRWKDMISEYAADRRQHYGWKDR
jgi:dTDP-4-dehydrorhamnose reductase